MTVSFVLRLVDECLSRGEIVGQAEHVESREREMVGDVGELLAFLQRARAADGNGDQFNDERRAGQT